MSSAPTASLLVLLTLGAVLAASAVAKVRDPLAFADGFVSLRVPPIVPRQAAVQVMPWAEGALAALLLVSPSAPLVVVGGLVVMIMAIYTWLIGRALTFGEAVDCACFGALGSHTVSWLTLARNLLLLALSGVAVWIGLSGGSAPGAVRDLHGGDWCTLAAALAAVVVAVTIVGGRADADPLPVGEPELDYERRPVPYGVLAMPDGSTATLAELASTQARLLVVLNPHCGPCVRTAEKLEAWAAELEPTVGVVAVHPRAGLDLPQQKVLATVEPDHNVRRIFSVGAPGAVLLGADGYLAGGPVAGEDEVAAFVEDVFAAITEQPRPTA